MMDLDELKADQRPAGHFHGDRVLRAVGEVVAGVRRIDTAARYGGDEFVVLLPETDPTGAFVLAEKIRLGVHELELELPDEADPAVAVDRGRVLPRRTAHRRRADDQRRPGDVPQQAGRQEPGHRRRRAGRAAAGRGPDDSPSSRRSLRRGPAPRHRDQIGRSAARPAGDRIAAQG